MPFPDGNEFALIVTDTSIGTVLKRWAVLHKEWQQVSTQETLPPVMKGEFTK